MNKKIKLRAIEATQKVIIVANGFLFSAIKVLADTGQKLAMAKYRICPPGPATAPTPAPVPPCAEQVTDVRHIPVEEKVAATEFVFERPIVDRFAKERNADPGICDPRIKRVERVRHH